MAIPSNPVLADLVLEGINKAGESNPSQSLLTRAQNKWIEEIKNDIWNLVKKPKILHVTSYTIFNKGQSRYSYPSDYSSDLSLATLYGTNQGICQDGAANTITLNSSDISGQEIVGKDILITAGTAQGSYSQIVTYDSTTKIAAVVPDFAMVPLAGDNYMIIDVEYPIETRPIFDGDARYKMVTPHQPRVAYPVGDDQQGYFILDSPPDKLYGARLRYYADLSQIDVNSTLMSVIYRRWRNIFLYGVKAKKLADEDDDNQTEAMSYYNQLLRGLLYREVYGVDISNITDRVTDYQ